jgi:hypothetical protein
MIWTPARIHGFEVKSYYKKLRSGGGSSFSWKKFGVPPKVAFFQLDNSIKEDPYNR